MKRFVKNAGLILLFMGGLLTVLYPTISNRWNEKRFQQLITTYDYMAEEQEGVSEEVEAVRQYNQTLTGSKVPDAFSVRDNVKDADYENLLNVSNNGIMGSIEIPAIDIKLPVYHYTTDEVLQKGVGHLFGSSLPIGGESTHCVLSAHRGLPNSKLFTDLNLLKKGDTFYIKVYDEVLAYEVDEIQVVEPKETEALAIEEGKDYVTLITCTPYAVNTHRLLVRGCRIPYDGEEYMETLQNVRPRISSSVWIHMLCIIAGVGIAVVVCRILPDGFGKKYGEKKKKKR